MKKSLFVLFLLIAATIQAQTLTNSAWTTMLPGDEEIEMVLNFDDDGECYIILTSETFEDLGDGMNMTMRASLSVPGIFNQDGRDITLSFNKKKAEFVFDHQLNGADSQTRALFNSFVEPELKKMEPELKSHLLEMVPSFIDNMKIVSVSKSKLVVGYNGGNLTFYPTGKG
jgi:hypothetical protein